MKKFIALFIAILYIAVISSCSINNNSKGVDDLVTAVTYTKFSTPYADLRIRDDIAEHINHKIEKEKPYTITFSAKKDDTLLFTLIFNGNSEEVMGTILGEDKNTVIYMVIEKFDSQSKNYNDYLFYQTAINDITNALLEDYDFVVGDSIDYNDNAIFDIQTSLCTIKYPQKWKDKVKIDITEVEIRFSNNGEPLFGLIFHDCDGYLLGKYKDTPIYIVDYHVWADEQVAMLQDVNVIIQNLMKDSNFAIQ